MSPLYWGIGALGLLSVLFLGETVAGADVAGGVMVGVGLMAVLSHGDTKARKESHV